MGKPRTILLKPWEVRRLLDGSKTMIARPVRWPTWANVERDGQELREFKGLAYFVDGLPRKTFRCPFGKPGTVLLGKEWWRLPTSAPHGWVDFKADDQREGFVWRPPQHMPPWAARLRLTVEVVTAKRCTEITGGEAWLLAPPEPEHDHIRRSCDESGCCSGAVADQWEHDNPRHPWESSWAWIATVRLESK